MDFDIGIEIEAKIHLRSDKAQQAGTVTFGFGVNHIPTKEEVDAAVKNGITSFNEALSVDDARFSDLSDYGFADMKVGDYEYSEQSNDQ